MKQNTNIKYINCQLMKAHQFLSFALNRTSLFTHNEKRHFRQLIMNIELIDIENLQLLNGHIDLELLFEEED